MWLHVNETFVKKRNSVFGAEVHSAKRGRHFCCPWSQFPPGGGAVLKCKVGAKSRMSLVNDILLILIRHGDVGVLRTLGERCLAANELEPVVQARMTVVGKLHRECSSALLRHLAYSDLEMTRSA